MAEAEGTVTIVHDLLAFAQFASSTYVCDNKDGEWKCGSGKVNRRGRRFSCARKSDDSWQCADDALLNVDERVVHIDQDGNLYPAIVKAVHHDDGVPY